MHKKIKIENIPKDHQFDVPQGYFEGFPEKLKKRIQQEDIQKSRRGNVWLYIRPHIALAAGILLFAFISTFTIRFLLKDHDKIYSESIVYSEILENQLDEFTLMEAYSEMDVKQEVNSENNRETEAYTDAMIEFLLSEDVEFELITAEL